MLSFAILIVVGENRLVALFSDVPNGDNTVMSSSCNQIWVVLGELTTC